MRLFLEWNGTVDWTRKPWKDGAGKIYCINWQCPLCIRNRGKQSGPGACHVCPVVYPESNTTRYQPEEENSEPYYEQYGDPESGEPDDPEQEVPYEKYQEQEVPEEEGVPEEGYELPSEEMPNVEPEIP